MRHKNIFFIITLLGFFLFSIPFITSSIYAKDKDENTSAASAKASKEDPKVKTKYSVKPDEDDSDMEVGFSSDEATLLGYGGILLGVTTFHGNTPTILDVRGGFIINQKYVVGIDFASTSTKPFKDDDDNYKKDLELEYSQLGLLLEYIPESRKLSHLVYSLILGSANAEYSGFLIATPASYEDYRKTRSSIFVLQPEVQFEYNLTKYTRVSIGAGLRVLSGGSDSKISNSDLMGINIMLGLKFGNFLI